MINIKTVAHHDSQEASLWLKSFEYSNALPSGLQWDKVDSEPTNKNRPGLGVM